MNNVHDKCFCGHVLGEHRTRAEGFSVLGEENEHWCNACSVSNKFTGRKCFHTFKLSNLDYLQNLYEQRTKTKA